MKQLLNKSIQKMRIFLPCLALAFALSAQASDALINYQGRLIEKGKLVNGSRTIEFRIHTTEAPFHMLYAETGVVNIVDGFYSFEVGANGLPVGFYRAAGPLFTNLTEAFQPSALWQGDIPEKELRVFINGIQLLPAEPIAYAPHALVAQHVVHNSIGSAQLQDGSVKAEHLAIGALTDPLETQHAAAFQQLAPLMDGSALPPEHLKHITTASAAITTTIGATLFSKGLAFRVEEAISEPLRAEVLFAGSAAPVNTSPWINNEAELTWSRNGSIRRFSGIVTKATRLGNNGVDQVYAVVIESHIARLRYNAGFSLWLEQTVSDIVNELLSNAGLNVPGSSASFSTQSVVFQHNETELDFISRLMEREGAWYIFGDQTPQPTARIGDRNAHFYTGPTLNYYGPIGSPVATNEEYICSFNEGSAAFSGSQTSRAYTDPNGTVVSGSATLSGGLGTIHTLSSAKNVSEANVQAQAGLSSAYHRNVTLGGFSTAGQLKPGRRTTIQDQSVGAAGSGTYLIDRVIHTGLCLPGATNAYYYANQFIARSLNESFVPEQNTTVPTPGLITATVTGPAGEKTYTDQYGRVKVQFHWDAAGSNDETSSGWIPVLRPTHGPKQSLFFVPEVGDEVLVNFIQNDPDRPVIIGSIPSAQQWPRHALPSDKDRMYLYNESSGGAVNEIRLDRKNGQENILMTSPTVDIEAASSLTLTGQENISMASPAIDIVASSNLTLNAPSISFPSGLSANSMALSSSLFSGVYTDGKLYADNQIVAWARISETGFASPSFGIVSATRIATGHYEITIDATMSGVNLIPAVTPEIDSQPTSSTAMRMASVNQITSPATSFHVYINNGGGTPVDNDFAFMVTGR